MTSDSRDVDPRANPKTTAEVCSVRNRTETEARHSNAMPDSGEPSMVRENYERAERRAYDFAIFAAGFLVGAGATILGFAWGA